MLQGAGPQLSVALPLGCPRWGLTSTGWELDLLIHAFDEAALLGEISHHLPLPGSLCASAPPPNFPTLFQLIWHSDKCISRSLEKKDGPNWYIASLSRKAGRESGHPRQPQGLQVSQGVENQELQVDLQASLDSRTRCLPSHWPL